LSYQIKIGVFEIITIFIFYKNTKILLNINYKNIKF
jgi:hypothetical protein